MKFSLILYFQAFLNIRMTLVNEIGEEYVSVSSISKNKLWSTQRKF